MPVATISHRDLLPRIKTYVSQTVIEIFDDPDFGMELSEYAKNRLRKAATSRKKSSVF